MTRASSDPTVSRRASATAVRVERVLRPGSDVSDSVPAAGACGVNVAVEVVHHERANGDLGARCAR